MMRETYRQVTDQLNQHPQECKRLEEERRNRWNKRYNDSAESPKY